MRRVMLLAAALALIAGCAGLSVSPGDSGRGIRYFQSSPYLLVHTDNSGGLKTELVYLPDPSKVMTAYPYGILANNNTTLDFQNGVLTGAESEPDATVIPKAVVSALEKVATASIAAALRSPEAGKPHVVPAPRLFKIEWDDKHNPYLVGPSGKVLGTTLTDVKVKGAPAEVKDEEEKDDQQKNEQKKDEPAKTPPPPSATPTPSEGGAQ